MQTKMPYDEMVKRATVEIVTAGIDGQVYQAAGSNWRGKQTRIHIYPDGKVNGVRLTHPDKDTTFIPLEEVDVYLRDEISVEDLRPASSQESKWLFTPTIDGNKMEESDG